MNRRVLIIACAFPPTGGPGVQRIAKFCKFLPRLGWRPTVWTHRALPELPRDDTLLRDIPHDIEVIRTGACAVETDVACGAVRYGRGTVATAAQWCRRAARWLRGPDWPDSHAPWARDSVAPLLRLAELRQFDAVLSTFSPPSNHWLAWEIKQRTGLPWVADFRDLWIDDYRYKPASRRHAAADRRFQQAVLDNADAVIGVTPRQTDILRSRAPDRAEVFHTITNGYDPDDFERAGLLSLDALAARRSTSVFTLSHVGRLDQYRSGEALFEGLRRFQAAIAEESARFQLRVVGHLGRQAKSELERFGISYVHTEYVRHGEAVREMMNAAALLLTTPEGPNADSVIPAKLFEYLAARRPILLVGPSTECERIVAECGAGVSAGRSAETIARQLGEWFDLWRSGRGLRGVRTNSLRAYSRVEQAKSLARLLEELTMARAGILVDGDLGKAAVA